MTRLLGQQLQQQILNVAAPPPAPPTAVFVERIAVMPVAATEVPIKSPVTPRGPALIGPAMPGVAPVWELLVRQAALCVGPVRPLLLAPPARARPSCVLSIKHMN